jgi:hypothetical protein
MDYRDYYSSIRCDFFHWPYNWISQQEDGKKRLGESVSAFDKDMIERVESEGSREEENILPPGWK